MFDSSSFQTPWAHIEAVKPDEALFYFSEAALRAEVRRFQQGFGGLVTYAVKANPAVDVLNVLTHAGINTFDVASPEEIALARAANPKAALHYNNPVRAASEVAVGKAAGVASWSVDCLSELGKLGVAHAGEEVAVRFKLPIEGGQYDFGEKFGAEPVAAAVLLAEAAARGYKPALTFHPGTQCESPEAWASYIRASAEIAKRAGVRLERLNVGGGFAARRTEVPIDLEAVFGAIVQTVRAAFGQTQPALVCEPGRAMVSSSYALLTRVKALRPDGSLFLNDGLYGGFAEWRDILPATCVQFARADGAPLAGPFRSARIFGPTCDSIDQLPAPVRVPVALSEGDYALFGAMGAYSSAISTRFNGYGPRETVAVERLGFSEN